MTPARKAIDRKVLQREDFGLCVCLPKTHWASVCEPGGTCEVLIDGERREVRVETEPCNCQGTGWHEHRFLRLPDGMEAARGKTVQIAMAAPKEPTLAADQLLTVSQVIGEVNDSLLFERPLSTARRKLMSRLLADQQGEPGCYHGLFAPVGEELANGYHVFTGEHVRSGGGARHILGEEALRALIVLQAMEKPAKGRTLVAQAIEAASASMDERLTKGEQSSRGTKGSYCCNRCSVALWRALAAGGIGDCEDRLACGLKSLHERRDGKGDWRGYTFYYTISALLDIPTDAAAAELEYAAPAMARRLKGVAGRVDEPYAGRRHALLERALSRAD